MSQNKKQIHKLIILIIIFINIITISSAEESFGISLDCYDSCNNKEIDYSKDIIFVLKIKNNLDYWVGLESEREEISLRLDIENRNLGSGENFETYSLGSTIFIEPKGELEFYIPFNLYNNYDDNKRLNEWKIYPELIFTNVNFYEKLFKSKETSLYINNQRFTINSPLKGNVLQFETVKPETEIQDGKPDITIPESFWKNPLNTNIIFPIVVVVIGSILVYLFVKKQ